MADLRAYFVPRVLSALALVASLGTSVAFAGAPVVRTVRVPDDGIQPQARVDERGRTHLIFFKGDPKAGDVFYTRSDDGAKSFSTPVRVNSQAHSVIAIGTVRGPHLAVGKNGRVHVAWMGSDKAEPKVGGKHAPMLYARMNDAGDGFEPQQNLIRQRPGLDGGGSVAADDRGNVYVAWHASKDRQHEEADRHVWMVRSTDEGRTFGEETAANTTPTGACGCCGMRLFASRRGAVLALYRSATEMVNRDMFLLCSTDAGTTFAATKVGPWRIGQCVMSTASIAEGPDGVLAAVWEQEGRVYVARLDPTTLKPGTPQSMPGSGTNRKHPVVAFGQDGRFLVAWTEGTGWNKGGEVVWQAFDAEGRLVSGQAGRVEGLQPWSVPAVVADQDGAFTIIY